MTAILPKEDFAIPDLSPGESTPYCLVGTARAKAGHADELEERLLSLVEPTRAEHGVLEYHVHRDRNDSNCFIFYEAWRSAADLREHLSKPYIRGFLMERMNYLEEDMEIRWIRMASPYPKA
jgi:quinol monooxygenase YgiN